MRLIGLCVVLTVGCRVDDPHFTNEAAAVDAATDAAVDDAATDAVPDDAPTDAAPDAATCTASETRCGTGCVDLAADDLNCGACGYEVRGGRQCVNGRPSPGWKTMAITNAPTMRAKIMGWTGRRFMVLTDGEQEFYDPDTNTWTANAFSRPAFSTSVSSEFTWARIPGRDELVMWGDDSTVYKFTDSGDTSFWSTLPTAGGPSPRVSPTIKATASDVYVAWGRGFEVVYRYHLADDTWHVSAEHGIDCGPSVARWMNPIAIVGNSLVTHGGYGHNSTYCIAPRLTLTDHPDMTTWSQGPMLTPRNAHVFMEFEGKLLYGGGQLTNGPVASSCAAQGLALIDVATGVVDNNVNRFTQPPIVPSNLFVVRTGRGLMVWGGRDPRCDNNTLTTYGTGSIGVPLMTAGALNIDWHVLPSTNAPPAKHSIPNDHPGWGDAQPMWTGHEAIVYGGYQNTWEFSGATYQPPAGCVCPSADAEACAGVTDVQPDCTP